MFGQLGKRIYRLLTKKSLQIVVTEMIRDNKTEDAINDFIKDRFPGYYVECGDNGSFTITYGAENAA